MKPRSQLAFDLVCKSLGGDVHKTNKWFHTFDSKLGCTPVSLMKDGHIEELIKWIRIKIDDGTIQIKKDDT